MLFVNGFYQKKKIHTVSLREKENGARIKGHIFQKSQKRGTGAAKLVTAPSVKVGVSTTHVKRRKQALAPAGKNRRRVSSVKRKNIIDKGKVTCYNKVAKQI